jgi:hypothetical protein
MAFYEWVIKSLNDPELNLDEFDLSFELLFFLDIC